MNDSVSPNALGTKHAAEQDDEISLSFYLDLLLDNRWLITTVTFVVTLLGAAYAFMAPPIYEANILVQVEDSTNSSAGIMGELAGAFDLKSAATAEIEILRSRYVVSRAVNNARLDLVVEPKYFPFIGHWIARSNKNLSEPGLFGFGGYAWGAEDAHIGQFNIPASLEGEGFVLTINGGGNYKLTQGDVGIEISGRVGELVTRQTNEGPVAIRVDQLLGKPGVQFIVKRAPLLDTIEELQKSLTIAEKGKQSGIIGVSLEGSNPQKTTNTLNEIGAEYIRQNVERKSAEAEKSLAFLEKQLPEMKANLEQAESKYNALRNSRGTVDLDEEAKTVLQQSVLSQTRLVELKQKRDELLTRYQETNPLVQAVNQQMRTLSDEIAALNNKIRTMPSIEQDVLRLTRDVKVSTDLYTSLLNSAQQLRLLKASKVGNARLLDQAIAPIHPTRPKRALLIAISAVVGVLLGVFCAYIRKFVFGGVEDPHEIESRLGLSVNASIPFSEKQVGLYQDVQAKAKKVSVLAIDAPTDRAIESLRSFRTSLQFSMLSAKNNIVMVTGPTPGIGKSFISVNFATVLASSGKKVLLIDADLRKGYLNNYFGLGRNSGLSEVIAGTLSLSQAVRKNVVENVDFLSTGALPPRPAELLSHDSLGVILRTVADQYDIVVVDTAPVLAVTDALIIARYSGTIFSVVRSHINTIGEIDETAKRIEQAGSNLTGVVFNGLKPRSGYGYGAKYGKYRYAEYKY